MKEAYKVETHRESTVAGRLMGKTVRIGVGLLGFVPTRLKKKADDSLFSTVFQVTRVTNDAYGWRPPPKSK